MDKVPLSFSDQLRLSPQLPEATAAAAATTDVPKLIPNNSVPVGNARVAASEAAVILLSSFFMSSSFE